VTAARSARLRLPFLKRQPLPAHLILLSMTILTWLISARSA
jgi:hypothetical protein